MLSSLSRVMNFSVKLTGRRLGDQLKDSTRGLTSALGSTDLKKLEDQMKVLQTRAGDLQQRQKAAAAAVVTATRADEKAVVAFATRQAAHTNAVQAQSAALIRKEQIAAAVQQKIREDALQKIRQLTQAQVQQTQVAGKAGSRAGDALIRHRRATAELEKLERLARTPGAGMAAQHSPGLVAARAQVALFASEAAALRREKLRLGQVASETTSTVRGHRVRALAPPPGSEALESDRVRLAALQSQAPVAPAALADAKKRELQSISDKIKANDAEIKAQQGRIKAQRAADVEQRRSMRAMSQGLRDHIFSGLFAATMKFTFLLGYVKRMMSFFSRAADYEFKAQGLSSLLGARSGAGESIYAAYRASSAYQREVSPTEAIGRMGDLAAAGYTQAEIPAAMRSIFDVLLAARGEITTAGAFDLGISLDRAFGGGGTSMADLLNTVVAAANKFPMTVGKVRDALSYATEAAVIYGQSLEETLITIGAVMPIAKTPSKAGTIARNTIMSLAKPKGLKILASKGVATKDEYGSMRPVLDVYADLDRALNSAVTAEQADIDARRGQIIGGARQRKMEQTLGKDELQRLREATKGQLSDAAIEQMTRDKDITPDLKARLIAGLSPQELATEAIKLRERQKVAQLKMTKEQLEYQITGQRGGAIFAALERLPQMAAAAWRGTALEGKTFKSTEDALHAFRSSLALTENEAGRIAGEMRKTSKVIEDSFKASVERASIAIGTAFLPAVSMFHNSMRRLLDWVAAKVGGPGLTGGSGVPGSSFTGNLVGLAGTAGGVYMGFSMLKSIFGILSQARHLTSPAMLAAMGTISQGNPALGFGAVMSQASMQVRAGAGGISKAFAWVGTGLATIGRALGPIGLVVTAVWMIKTAFDTAREAITDFTDLTRRSIDQRSSKMLDIATMLLTAKAEGRLGFDPTGPGRITGLRRKEVEALEKRGGARGATLAEKLGAAKTREEIQKVLDTQLAGALDAEFMRAVSNITDKDERETYLKAHRERMADFMTNVVPEKLVQYALSGGGNYTQAEGNLFALQERVKAAQNPTLVAGQEIGGPAAAYAKQMMQQYGGKTLSDVWGQMGLVERRVLRDVMMEEIGRQYDKGDKETFNAWLMANYKGKTLGKIPSAPTIQEVFLQNLRNIAMRAERGEAIPGIQLPQSMADMPGGVWPPGMPAPMYPNIEPSLQATLDQMTASVENAKSQTDALQRAAEALMTIADRLPNTATAPAIGKALGDAINGIFPNPARSFGIPNTAPAGP